MKSSRGRIILSQGPNDTYIVLDRIEEGGRYDREGLSGKGVYAWSVGLVGPNW